MAILLTSLTAGIIGYLWLMFFSKENADIEDLDTISYGDEQ
jgi:Na+/H+ antiporter NhaA